MEILAEKYILYAVVVWVYMTLWFGVSLVKKRNDVADIAWGLGILLISVVSYITHIPTFDGSLLMTALVAVWAIRLATHIYYRNRGKAEDARYQVWRNTWGKWFYIRSYFQVFLLQGCLMLIVGSPIVIGNIFYDGNFGVLQIIGVIVWLIGFYFESIGDKQLATFIKNPENKGKILQTGLWQYTRHPNYFGEVTMWWGIWLIACSVPYGVLGIVGPITISFLILKVSGIPMLEKKKEHDPSFQEYKKRVSMFFPLPPKQRI